MFPFFSFFVSSFLSLIFKGNPNDLCASADQLCLQIPQLVDASRGLASYSGANAKRLLQQAKNLAIAMQKLSNEW